MANQLSFAHFSARLFVRRFRSRCGQELFASRDSRRRRLAPWRGARSQGCQRRTARGARDRAGAHFGAVAASLGRRHREDSRGRGLASGQSQERLEGGADPHGAQHAGEGAPAHPQGGLEPEEASRRRAEARDDLFRQIELRGRCRCAGSPPRRSRSVAFGRPFAWRRERIRRST